jgi:hypothetical protein
VARDGKSRRCGAYGKLILVRRVGHGNSGNCRSLRFMMLMLLKRPFNLEFRERPLRRVQGHLSPPALNSVEQFRMNSDSGLLSAFESARTYAHAFSVGRPAPVEVGDCDLHDAKAVAETAFATNMREPGSYASNSLNAVSMNSLSEGFTPNPAAWPQIEGIGRSSALGISSTSSSLSRTRK